MSELVRQDKSVAALLMLLLEDLPGCSWIVYRDTGLEGWIVDTGENDARDDIERWAKRFGSNVLHAEARILVTSGSCGHIPVKIFAKDPR